MKEFNIISYVTELTECKSKYSQINQSYLTVFEMLLYLINFKLRKNDKIAFIAIAVDTFILLILIRLYFRYLY